MDIDQAKNALGKEFGFIVDDVSKSIDHIQLPVDAEILDVGTGLGNCAIILALKGYRVLTGEPVTDDSIYAKQDWKNSAQKVGVDHLIRFEAFDAEKMPFENGRFDTIFFCGVLHHIEEGYRKDVFHECIRTTKPEGIICFFEPNHHAMKIVRKHIPSHPEPADPNKYTDTRTLVGEKVDGNFFDAFIYRKIGSF